MIDKTPYIIVDDQKIFPIHRSARPGSTHSDPSGRKEQPFGVVDRVTISREAREKFRQQAQAGSAPENFGAAPIGTSSSARHALRPHTPHRLS